MEKPLIFFSAKSSTNISSSWTSSYTSCNTLLLHSALVPPIFLSWEPTWSCISNSFSPSIVLCAQISKVKIKKRINCLRVGICTNSIISFLICRRTPKRNLQFGTPNIGILYDDGMNWMCRCNRYTNKMRVIENLHGYTKWWVNVLGYPPGHWRVQRFEW